MTASFTAYIDESGDEGFVFLPGEKGTRFAGGCRACTARKAQIACTGECTKR